MPEKSFVSVEYWRRHSQQLRSGLLERLDELSVSDYPGATPNEVIRFLQSFLAELESVINKTDSEDRLKSFVSLVQQLGVFLEWLDNAHTAQTPRGLVKMLKDLIEHLDPSARVLARPQAQYNYSILDIDKILNKIVVNFLPHSKQEVFLNQLKSPIRLISFPRIERDNLLAHAVFGHELGHPIADEYLSSEASQPKHQAEHAEIQKKVLELVAKTTGGKDLDQAGQLAACTQLFSRILQIRKRALEELISDAVAVLIFGPSFFFAMFELLWSSNWDARPQADSWYPPPRFRLRLMLRLMDDAGYLPAICESKDEFLPASYSSSAHAFVQEARRLCEITSDVDAINAIPPMQIAYEWMNGSIDGAIAFAKEKTHAVAFNWESMTKQLAGLLQRIELGVPPNEVGDPLKPETVDYRASLLSAWIFKLRGIGSATGQPFTSKELARLNMQTLSAVEYVLLQREYAKHCAAQN